MIVKDGIKMNKRIKVIQIIPTLELGGAEIMVENLSVALNHLNNDVKVISLYSKTTPISRRLENNRIPVFYLDKKIGFDWKIFTKLYKLLKTERPDVIHTHLYATTYVVPVAKLLKVKVIVHTIHSIADKEVSLARQRIYDIYYKFLKVKPVAISSMIRESFQKVYKWSGENIPLINNGIDLNKCISKVHELDSSKHIKIIHIGSFKEAKNHLGLIDSFNIVHKKNANTILELIGNGQLEADVRKRVNELGLANYVVFLGVKEDVFSYLSESDIFVLPSLWEGMPISLIEAMGTALPIVATKVGGIPDMIEDRVNGLLVNIDVNEIAQAMLELADSYELRKQLGENAQKSSEQYSARNMTLKYLKLYCDLL